MKKLQVLLTGFVFALAGVAHAHGPVRHKVVESIEINATPDAVWAIVGNFAKPEVWLPPVASTTETGGNEVGATRELTLKKGGVVKEELKKYEVDKKTLGYKITEVDPAVLPVATYTSTIMVEAAGAGSKVEWNGAFYRSFMNNNPPPEQSDEAAIHAVTQMYKEGLANLKQVAEKK
ncbi:SRPBCC family protein [Candidatus Methylospira mobilis]|uniref:SRPBCC family protein n=1 Tax=Candidatus Methylospira mobilis TaxID=1808979 RepID=A0A5Q0BM17_9GAMM|nr:SRPBCC family protein [Candidatus Methylospira mobilis]QFY42796.1 SRPBCC family protein [Candidatus Methylospira mobilis]WNV03688.1 SRPBCC family protein [Candidatus Methylospira mobilis]